ncbi:MAG: hypothetical protein ACYCW6_15955 [Candidatus Xenobia bacterium]
MLLLAMVVVAVAASVGALAAFQLSSAQQAMHSQDAVYLSESAIMQCIAELHASPMAQPAAIRYQPDPQDRSRLGILTCDSTERVHATNNMDGQHFTGWNNTPVPQGMADLVATGVSRGQQRTVEVMVSLPAYPFAISTQGTLNVQGALDVSGTYSMQSLQAGLHTLPANVGSNGQVSLQGGAITGDVVYGTVGQAPRLGGTHVYGQVKHGHVDIPDASAAHQRNQTVADIPTLIANIQPVASAFPASGQLPPQGGGIYYSSNPLTLSSLHLQHDLLYVDGDVNINGALDGVGALVVKGRITARGAALSADNMVALMATRDVTLKGNQGDYFQGLVYTGGLFSASDLTIAGQFVAGGTNGSMSLTNVSVVHVPLPSQISNQAAQPLQFGTTQPDHGGSPFTTNRVGTTSGAFWQNDANNIGVNSANPASPVKNSMMTSLDLGIAGNPLYSQLMGSVPNALGQGRTVLYYPLSIFPTGAQQSTIILSGNHVLQFFVYSLHFNPASGRYEMLPPQILVCDETLSPVPQNVANQALQQAHSGLSVDDVISLMLAAQSETMHLANGMMSHQIVAGKPFTQVDLSLNKFLTDSTPLQIGSWRVH